MWTEAIRLSGHSAAAEWFVLIVDRKMAKLAEDG